MIKLNLMIGAFWLVNSDWNCRTLRDKDYFTQIKNYAEKIYNDYV